MHLPKFSDMHISHLIHWALREGLPEPPIPAHQEKDLSLYHSHIVLDDFLKFPTNFTEKERDHLFRINVSLFEAMEIQDVMNTQSILQHLCTIVEPDSAYIHNALDLCICTAT